LPPKKRRKPYRPKSKLGEEPKPAPMVRSGLFSLAWPCVSLPPWRIYGCDRSYNGLRQNSAAGVQHHVGYRWCASRHEGLMEFIKGGIAQNDAHRRQRPFEPYAYPVATDPAQQEQAQDKILRQVPRFSNVVLNQA